MARRAAARFIASTRRLGMPAGAWLPDAYTMVFPSEVDALDAMASPTWEFTPGDVISLVREDGASESLFVAGSSFVRANSWSPTVYSWEGPLAQAALMLERCESVPRKRLALLIVELYREALINDVRLASEGYGLAGLFESLDRVEAWALGPSDDAWKVSGSQAMYTGLYDLQNALTQKKRRTAEALGSFRAAASRVLRADTTPGRYEAVMRRVIPLGVILSTDLGLPDPLRGVAKID